MKWQWAEDAVVVRSHQSVDWELYFLKIKPVCPWSYAAWQRGQIEIVYTKFERPLGDFAARVYAIDLTKRRLKKLAKLRDHGESEWLWSHPEYGAYATPMPCLIQQDRAKLNSIRKQIICQ
jgi:hypothetical protein